MSDFSRGLSHSLRPRAAFCTSGLVPSNKCYSRAAVNRGGLICSTGRVGRSGRTGVGRLNRGSENSAKGQENRAKIPSSGHCRDMIYSTIKSMVELKVMVELSGMCWGYAPLPPLARLHAVRSVVAATWTSDGRFT